MAKFIELIEDLKKDKNAVIMAHYSQKDPIKDIADFIGDSLFLSTKAAEIKTEIVVSCGSNYAAENIKIFAPNKIVLQPDVFSVCKMIQKFELEELKELKEINPEAAVVADFKSSAEMKALSDICCTDANAVELVDKMFEDEVIFLPDKNLGEYINKKSRKKIITVDSYCPAHNSIKIKDIRRLKNIFPDILTAVHPGCRPGVIENADFVDDYRGILEYVNKSALKKFAVGAERVLLYQLKKENPDKRFFLLNHKQICRSMKRNNLNKIANALKYMETIIEIDDDVRLKARNSIKKMEYYSI
jgi:quinolinate synthase